MLTILKFFNLSLNNIFPNFPYFLQQNVGTVCSWIFTFLSCSVHISLCFYLSISLFLFLCCYFSLSASIFSLFLSLLFSVMKFMNIRILYFSNSFFMSLSSLSVYLLPLLSFLLPLFHLVLCEYNHF